MSADASILFTPDDWYGSDTGDLDESCPECGGEGIVEYQDCPSAWGEDCPSEVNHFVTCPNCGGSGDLKDCTWM